MQNRNLTNLQKKNRKITKTFSSGSNICNKIKLFKNVIYFFSSNVSSVESECKFDKSAAIFSLNVREVFTKLRKNLQKVTTRRRPLSTKLSSRRVKSIFVSSKKKLCQISKIISLKAKSLYKNSLYFQKLSSLKKLLRRCMFRFWQYYWKVSPKEWNLSTRLPKHLFKEFLSCSQILSFSCGVAVDN